MGKEVSLSSAHGIIVRVVLKIDGDVLTVCRREELEAATAEGREPLSVGFRMRDVLD